MRSDSILSTGLTSASIGKASRAKEARDERMRLKDAKRTTLLPAAEVVITEIDKEIQVTQVALLEMINTQTTTEQAKDIIASLNLYTASMKKLKSRLSNIMRTRDGQSS